MPGNHAPHLTTQNLLYTVNERNVMYETHRHNYDIITTTTKNVTKAK